MSDLFYESSSRVAIYLEMEWSDWLQFPSDESIASAPQPPKGPVLPTFYIQTVQFLLKNLAVSAQEKVRICDVGGGTGRFLFEWTKTHPFTEEALLVEPSRAFCDWALGLLVRPEPIPAIPIVSFFDTPIVVPSLRNPPKIASFTSAKLFVECTDSSSIPRPANYFDIVTCLNVVDRVKNPENLILDLHRILKPNGLLILASPLDWIGNRSSVEEEKIRIQDLKAVLDPNHWIVLDETELGYALRPTTRCYIKYISQVLAISKRA